MTTTIGGYLTKHGTCDGGHYELRVLTSPRVSIPRSKSNIVGYYTDEYGDAETLQPCLALLPHGRYLAGWTMGEEMSTGFEPDVYEDERAAWQVAHRIAERDAEAEREYRASRCPKCYDNERRGDGELPELCETCYLDSPNRTLAHHTTE